MKKISWIAFFLLVVFNGYGQQYRFINYSVEQGLAASQITTINQDHLGYLWIGTLAGLSRFDGYEFVNFSIEDGLADNNIEKIYVYQKELWIASANGVALRKQDEFDKFLLPINISKLVDLTYFQDELYIATSSDGLFVLRDQEFIQLTSENYASIRSISNYNDQRLICAGKDGIFEWYENEFHPFENGAINQLNISDIEVAGDELIFSTYGEGIGRYSFTKEAVEWHDMEPRRIRSIYADTSLVLGAMVNGVVELQNNQSFLYREFNGLLTSSIKAVFKDHENNYWIGTDGKGLLKFMGKSIITYTTKDGLSSDLITCISEDNDGNYLFGTYEAGLTYFYDDSSYLSIDRSSDTRDNVIWTIHQTSDNISWVGTSRGMFYIKNRKAFVPDNLKDFTAKTRSILMLRDSTYLFGGGSGIFHYNGNIIRPIEGTDTMNVNDLMLYNRMVYVATSNGLYNFDPEDPAKIDRMKLPEKFTYCLTMDHDGNLWIGTSNGLFIYHQNFGLHEVEIDRDEFRARTIWGMITDHRGNIWVSTSNGVYNLVLEPNSVNYDILHYSVTEGLINPECNQNALYEDKNHFIWVGTAGGLCRIDPSQNNSLFEYKEPQLHLIGIRLFMEDFEYSNYPCTIDESTGLPVSITFPHNKNHLTFDFIGINLKNPESVSYEYRLVGAEDNWSPISNENKATYSFLAPGNYHFEVRATNKGNMWSPVQTVYVEILSPYWKTWWFILLVILAAALVLFLIFRNRINVIKQKQENENLQYRNRLLFLEQKSLNASMNRHFIFNSLNSIQYFINSQDRKSANKYLSNFAKLIRKNLDSSMANNFIVSLQEEIERIELYLSLEAMRFENRFDYIVDVSSDIDTESIEIPSMILQPFVENSIIHGVLPLERKGNISVKIYREFEDIVFEVTDDGTGIDNSLNEKNKTIEGDHISKGVEITNRRIDLLRKLTGEKLMIIGPYQMDDEEGNCLGTKVIIKMRVHLEQ